MPPRHIAAIVAINAVFAGVYLLGKIGVAHFPPLFFSALRFCILAALLAPFLRITPALRKRWRSAAAFCILMGPMTYATLYLSLAAADGVAAIFIGTQASTPIAVLLGHYLLGEKTGTKAWLGIWLAFIGVMAVGFDAALLGYPGAFALILASAACYAGANVVSRGLSGAAGILNLNAWMSLLSAPTLLAMSWAWEDGQTESLQAAGWTEWLIVLYSALVVSMVGHMGMFALLRRHRVSAVMPYYVLTPIFGVAGGMALFGEELTTKFLLGAVAALVGVFWVNRNLPSTK